MLARTPKRTLRKMVGTTPLSPTPTTTPPQIKAKLIMDWLYFMVMVAFLQD
jgi:hypothetical protein